MAAFPLRLVYLPQTGQPQPETKILISVPKRCFKRAVKRNRVKRQVREAYRKNKALLAGRGSYMLAFIWLDDKLWNSPAVERKVLSLLQRLSEKVLRQQPPRQPEQAVRQQSDFQQSEQQ